MAWVRLDDSFHAHRKLHRAGLEAAGLYAFALSYCAHYLTDGHVDGDWLERTIPQRRRRERLLETLVDQCLFVPNGNGYAIHDYLDYNPSKREVEGRRKAAADRKRAERERKGVAK